MKTITVSLVNRQTGEKKIVSRKMVSAGSAIIYQKIILEENPGCYVRKCTVK